METQSLKGIGIALKIRSEAEARIAALKARGLAPCMHAVAVGPDKSIESYIDVKRRLAEKLGVEFMADILPAETSQQVLEDKLRALSGDKNVHGILLELPLGDSINVDQAVACIDPKKDIDGLTAHNLGLALAGNEEGALMSATAQACVALAESLGSLSGKRVALVGKGRTVGKPLIPMLLNRGATLTVCHSKTLDLRAAVSNSEIIFTGVGKPGLINSGVIQSGQIIIDAGGDAAADIWGVAAAATPAEGGVGPLTTAFIFQNLLKAIQLQNL